jgi:hypothetical protein
MLQLMEQTKRINMRMHAAHNISKNCSALLSLETLETCGVHYAPP